MDIAKNVPQARRDKQRFKSSHTLDSLGGGHLLKAESPDMAQNRFRPLELLSYKDDNPQNMMLIARSDKRKHSSSITLDPLGGGNLVKIVDPDVETEFFRSLNSSPKNQMDIAKNVPQARRDNQKFKSSHTLDPLGGGHLLKAESPDMAQNRFRSLELLSHKDDNPQNIVLVARSGKQKHYSSGTLDSLGGGHLLKIVDPDVETEVFRSLNSFPKNEMDNVPQARRNKQRFKSSYTLDPLGGGHLLKAESPDMAQNRFRSLELLSHKDDNPQNIVLVARSGKQKHYSSGTLDSLGGGHILKIVDPDVETEVFRSLNSFPKNQMDNVPQARRNKQRFKSSYTLDPLGGGHLLKAECPDMAQNRFRSLELLSHKDDNPQNIVLVARSGKQKHYSSGTLDSLGGGHILKIVDPDVETEVFRSLNSFPKNQMDNVPQARRNKQRFKSSYTLDPLGGGHLLKAECPDMAQNRFRSLELLSHKDDNPQNIVLVARSGKQKHYSSGTLDSLGGGHILKIVDPDVETEVFRSLNSFPKNQMDVAKNVPQARRDNQKFKSSHTLDPLGGGHLLKAESPDMAQNRFRSLELLSHKDDNPQNMMLIARSDKQKHSSSGTLDPLGGDHLLKIVDPDVETEFFRSLNSFSKNQDDNPQNVVLVARSDKRKHSSSITLDPLGGGNLVKIVDPDVETEFFRSLNTFPKNEFNSHQNLVSLAREDKQKTSSSGTLDPIGGGNLVKVVDPDVEAEFFRSLNSFPKNQFNGHQNLVSLAREDKQKPSSSGTLDPLGGGNLVKVVDPDVETEFFRSLNSFPKNQFNSHQNLVSLAREDKQKPSSSGTLDPLGGGNLVKVADSDVETEFFRSLNSFPKNQFNSHQNLVSLAREDKQKPSSSGTLDPLGGGNLVKVADPDVETEFFRSLNSFPKIQFNSHQNLVSLAREDKQKPSSSGTLDPLGGGNLVKIVDPDVEAEFFRSLNPFSKNQGRQNMMRLAREDKSTQRSSHALDGLGGGQMLRSLDLSHWIETADQGDVMRLLDSISANDLLSSLDSTERMAVLNALRKNHTKYPKRMLDSVSGWTFGESKRNFDEIDNVGFTGFAKRYPARYRQLALAKKNFDEIDRAGFETYNKRDFDEIDRAGFETFEKRDRKE